MTKDKKGYQYISNEQIKYLKALEESNPDFKFEKLPIATMQERINSRFKLSMAIHDACAKADPAMKVMVGQVSNLSLFIVEAMGCDPELAGYADFFGIGYLAMEVDKHIANRAERNEELNRIELKGMIQ